MTLTKSDKIVYGSLGGLLVIVVFAMIYFNTGDRADKSITGDAVAMGKLSPNGKNATLKNSTQTTPKIIVPVKKHVLLELGDKIKFGS